MQFLGVLILLIFALMFGCQAIMTRSTTIELEGSGYELTYTMHWGLGMEQSFSLTRRDGFGGTVTSKNVEIWERPYNSGMALYRSEDGSKYHFGLGYASLAFDVATKSLKFSCLDDRSLTELGRELEGLANDPQAVELRDPGRDRVFGYIETTEVETTAGEPIRSRYCSGMVFLGKLGLIRPRRDGFRRGDSVGFAPADRIKEPRLALKCAG